MSPPDPGGRPVVLDADGLDALSATSPPPLRLRALLAEANLLGRDVIVPAVVCAEVCRGAQRTRAVENAIARGGSGKGRRPPIVVVPTDLALARQVGALLHAAGTGSQDMVDAHVVAVCVSRGGGLVITADPDDIVRLAQAVPSVRIVTRPAR